ncbi:GNAT family N-acetyltransferase [Bacillus rhizoplanae]|uniref:GNAT family N-acetyltransferase n=1 Tax=Bacillus rhizoplanae TaxID=2880966 RepID=UPI003D207BB6
MEQLIVERISQDKAPISLLLLADPSERQLQSYLQRGMIYVAKRDEHVIGSYILLETRPNTMEIMNIAVCEQEQGKGIGKQLALYQKCGFRIFSIDFDYFSKHYEEENIENGIVCRDMIRLTMDLY